MGVWNNVLPYFHHATTHHPAFISRCDDAFEETNIGPSDFLYPIAILPTNVHPRMRSQRGCLRCIAHVRRALKVSPNRWVLQAKDGLRKYRVAKENAGEIPRELRLLGISDSTLSPDHDGLSIDLKRDFKKAPIQSRADDHIPVVEQLPKSRKA